MNTQNTNTACKMCRMKGTCYLATWKALCDAEPPKDETCGALYEAYLFGLHKEDTAVISGNVNTAWHYEN